MTKQETPQEKQNREMVEEIATNISQLSRQVKSLLSGRVKERTIIILLANSTGLPKSTVKAVLDALVGLEAEHLSK